MLSVCSLQDLLMKFKISPRSDRFLGFLENCALWIMGRWRLVKHLVKFCGCHPLPTLDD